MVEALWSVDFQSNFGFVGTGIAVFETNRVFGGDSAMIYVGSYQVGGGHVDALINVRKYANVHGLSSAVGLDSFNLQVRGEAHHDEMFLTGHVVEDPARTLNIRAIRRAELP